MKKIRVTRERLFAALRSEGIKHLGQVKRLYMEANGEFSLVNADDERPGLSVIPQWDEDFRSRQKQMETMLCKTCGSEWKDTWSTCANCTERNMEAAIIVPSSEASSGSSK